jgi:hypothetical protein
MTDKISQRPIPPLDPPEQFGGGGVVARRATQWMCPPIHGGT